MFLILAMMFLNIIIEDVICMDCNKLECVSIADPLIREPNLVFPDKQQDIVLGCRTWNRLVDCLKEFTEQCFSEQQRRVFNTAVESPIENIHQLCMDRSYQAEYLKYAPCIKSTIIERTHCGLQYNLLVDQVSRRDIASKASLCCSHDRFKQCVERETRRVCDRGLINGPASRFSSQILEKSLSFLHDQCVNYIPSSGDCNSASLPASNRYNPQQSDVLSINGLPSQAPSDVYPWSTIRQDSSASTKEITSYSRSVNNKPRASDAPTLTSWLPSSSIIPSYPQDDSNSIGSASTVSSTKVQEVLGSRTRPASYGRANNWSSDAVYKVQQQPVGSQQVEISNNGINSINVPFSTTSSRPDWATVATWNGMGTGERNPTVGKSYEGSTISGVIDQSKYLPSTTTTTWYPAAGNQLSNEVDEPNQQGLRNYRNSSNNVFNVSTWSYVLLIIGYFLT